MNRVAIVILNYLTYELTLDCLNNITPNLDKRFFIVVVDNKSPNKSEIELNTAISKMQKDGVEVYFLKAEKNAGYSAGNNIGLAFAKEQNAKYVVVMNNDIKIENFNVFSKLQKMMEEDSSVAIIGPKIITNGLADAPLVIKRPNGVKIIAKNFLYPLYVYLGGKKRHFSSEYNNPFQVYSVSGCFFFADLSILEEVGFLDENVFLYGEELLIGEKLFLKGYKTIYNPTVSVNHEHSQTISSRYSNNQRERIMDNSLKYYYKKRSDLNKITRVLLGVSWIFKSKIILPMGTLVKGKEG